MIPKALLDKYDMPTLEAHIENCKEATDIFPNEDAIKKDFYTGFLQRTSVVLNDLTEGIAKTEDYAEELYYREIARQELTKLNGETPVTVENQKTLEQRATQTEADNAFIAMMLDIDLEG